MQRVAAAFSRMEERDALRLRAGGRSQLVQDGVCRDGRETPARRPSNRACLRGEPGGLVGPIRGDPVRDRAASTRAGTSGLHRICETGMPTVLTQMTSASAIWRFVRPLARRPRTSSSRGVSPIASPPAPSARSAVGGEVKARARRAARVPAAGVALRCALPLHVPLSAEWSRRYGRARGDERLDLAERSIPGPAAFRPR
jgi:hypothetical protein